MIRSCPNCEKPTEHDEIELRSSAIVNGRNVSYPARVYRCRVCGEEHQTPEQLDAALAAARMAKT